MVARALSHGAHCTVVLLLLSLASPLPASDNDAEIVARLIEKGELEKAEEVLREIIERGSLDVIVKERLGDLRRAQWRLDEARALYIARVRRVGVARECRAQDRGSRNAQQPA